MLPSPPYFQPCYGTLFVVWHLFFGNCVVLILSKPLQSKFWKTRKVAGRLLLGLQRLAATEDPFGSLSKNSALQDAYFVLK